MPTQETNPKTKTRIAIIGKFLKMHDEEYIAQGFENIGCEVDRISQVLQPEVIKEALDSFKPDILLYTKWDKPAGIDLTGITTVCWLFDLYFNYHREWHLKTRSFFMSDYVFTTDGGNQKRFEELGINHKLLRQGIRTEECYMEYGQPKGVVFVGSDNPMYPYRQKMLGQMILHFKDFKWYGRGDTDEMRGTELNTLYGNTKVVVGDSVYSPYYWSNRVVETLGRGGFLIHPDVEGIKEEYPHLVTYKVGDIEDLKEKVNYYLTHEAERREIVQKNWQWVRDNYTIEHKCQELLNEILKPHN